MLELSKNKKGLIILIDPDKIDLATLAAKVRAYESLGVNCFFIGSSQPLINSIDQAAQIIKENSNLPLIIFPGSPKQLTAKADGVLFISLVSGRDPKYLIETHVKVAKHLKKMNLKVLPTGYILVKTGKETAVERISKTSPLNEADLDSITSHALAAQYLGMNYVYLEAGSGAEKPISEAIVRAVKKELDIPLIVGGGIKTVAEAKAIKAAGADFIVIGNIFEKYSDLEFAKDFIASL